MRRCRILCSLSLTSVEFEYKLEICGRAQHEAIQYKSGSWLLIRQLSIVNVVKCSPLQNF